jgi:DNA-binding NarL/FixJ family response regulator
MEKKPAIRALLVDRHHLVREAMRCLIETQPDLAVVAAAADASDAVRLAKAHHVNVAIARVTEQRQSLPLSRALAAIRVPLIVVSPSIDRASSAQAIQAGTRGLLPESAAPALLFKSIRSVADGQYWVGRATIGDVIDTMRQLRSAGEDGAQRRFDLTQRELEVIAAVAAGDTNRVIAQRFSISEDTVKHHLTHIFDKLGVFTRLELALFAINHSLVPAAAQAQSTMP